MKLIPVIGCAFLTTCAAAPAQTDTVTARGMLYITFDMVSETTVNGVLFARFVPDEKDMKLFPAVTSGPHPGPVRHISFEPPEPLLEAAVGKEKAAQLSHGTESEMQIPVELVLRNFSTEIECDSRVYRAMFVSLRPQTTQMASARNPPHGC